MDWKIRPCRMITLDFDSAVVPNCCSLDDVAIERWFDEGGSTLAPPIIPGLPPIMNLDGAGPFRTAVTFSICFFDMSEPIALDTAPANTSEV